MIVFGILVFACQKPEQKLLWLKIDPHVHSSVGSNDTDGLGTPERIRERLIAAQLDGIWVSDHSNAQGSMHCDDPEDCPNLGPELSHAGWPENVLLASEISPRSDELSQATGHVGCLPLEKNHFTTDAFVDRPFGTVTGAMAVDACRQAQGFTIVNHPFGPTPWVAFDFSTLAFDGLEIYNGSAGFDRSDAQAFQYWEEQLAQGRFYIPIGGSDCHRWDTPPPGDLLNPSLGWPHTKIGIKEGEEWITGLIAGRVIIGDPSSSLMLYAQTPKEAYYPGMKAPINSTLIIEAHTDEEAMRVELRSAQDGIIIEAELTEPQKLIFESAPKGIYYARIMPIEERYGIRGIALTAPIFVE